MNRIEPQNANKVSNLIQRYEELAKNNYIRPFLRRWRSTNSANIDTTVGKSSIARRIDKLAIPRNKPNGNGCSKGLEIKESSVGVKKDGDEELKVSKLKVNSETDKIPNTTEHVQPVKFRKNSQVSVNNHDHMKLQNETKKKPLKARSIEDFEELIYFDEVTKETLQPSCEVSNEIIREESVEAARKRAKEEEERYRRSFSNDIENDEDVFEENTVTDDEVQVNVIDDGDEVEQIHNTTAESKPKIKKDKKEFVVDELISSERIYISHLELVIKNYLRYLKQQRYDNDTIRTIFSNIESIHEHSQIFLLHLENCGYNYAEIGKVFCKHRELFDKYPKYCRDRSKSYNMITTDLKLIVSHRQLKLEDKLGLNSSLLKPIQRLAKYELLLINLNNTLLNEGTTVASIQNAITLIQRTARIADTMVILNKILRCPYNYNDIGPLILQEEFRLLTPEKIDTTVFLFGKMLILTEKSASKEEYNYRHSVPIDALRLNRRKSRSLLFLEHYNDKIKKSTVVYTLEGKDAKVLSTWFKEIHEILWKQLETYKGNAQREAFKSSLNHFKSIDNVDSSEKSTKITTNGKSNRHSKQEDQTSKVINNKKKHLEVNTKKSKIDKPRSREKSPSTQSVESRDSERAKEKKKHIDRRMAMIHRM